MKGRPSHRVKGRFYPSEIEAVRLADRFDLFGEREGWAALVRAPVALPRLRTRLASAGAL
jgi:hypothetical protein